MEYKYHCQRQAESFASAILPVPDDYPLRDDLPEDFRPRFTRLCELAKDIYMNMAISPESYGLMLVDIQSQDRNLARDGYRTIHRFVDTLSRLSQCGELKNHQLIVRSEAFRQAVKKGAGAVSGPVPKYELILARLVDFGFIISGFVGKPFDKKVEFFTIEYPDDPEMIDTIKTYCECWDALKTDRKSIKIWPEEFHHHFYRFDYKVTANCDEIPMTQWLSDEADYYGFSSELKRFSVAYYKYSLKYKGIMFDGDYHYKSKRITRIYHAADTADGKKVFRLSLKIKDMDKYMPEIITMPDSLKKHFAKNSCNCCGFQGATKEYCKFRLRWTFGAASYTGCAYQCFAFDDFDLARVPDYFRLLELEYGLKSA